MALALEEARIAAEHGDTPVGAAIYQGETLLAAAGNRREVDLDPTAHAELLVIREAARMIAEDDRLSAVQVPLGDGILIAARD